MTEKRIALKKMKKRTNTLHSVNQVFSHNVSAAHWLPLSSEKEQNTKNE